MTKKIIQSQFEVEGRSLFLRISKRGSTEISTASTASTVIHRSPPSSTEVHRQRELGWRPVGLDCFPLIRSISAHLLPRRGCGGRVSIKIPPGPTGPHRDPQGPTRRPSGALLTNPNPLQQGFLTFFMQGPLNKLFEALKPSPIEAPPGPTGSSPTGPVILLYAQIKKCT